MSLEIPKIESVEFEYPIEDVGTDGNGFNLVFDPESTTNRQLFGLRIHTDGSVSQYGHWKLSELIKTPLLQTERVGGVEQHTDFIANGATDFVRTDPEYDGGITGAIKIARVAEGVGLDDEIHGPGPAKRHCMAAIRNTNYYELALLHPDCRNTQPPEYEGGNSDFIDTVASDGSVPVPDGLGMGVESDWGYIEDHSLGRRTYS